MRDNLLVHKLCSALECILGDAPLEEGAENYLLASFSPRVQFNERRREDREWSRNPDESHVSVSDVHRSKPSNFELTLGAG